MTCSNETIIIVIVVVVALILLFLYYRNCNSKIDHFVAGQKLKITFLSPWGKTDSENIINFPKSPLEKPHTGNMLLVLHDENYKMFDIGKDASEGIAQSAMYGINDILISDIKSKGYKYYTASSMETPGQQSFAITYNPKFPLLSFTTMIAPSPDWFTGLPSVDLREISKIISDKNLKTGINLPLYVLNAGVDYGTEFKTYPKKPRGDKSEPINIMKGEPFTKPNEPIPPIAMLNISFGKS